MKTNIVIAALGAIVIALALTHYNRTKTELKETKDELAEYKAHERHEWIKKDVMTTSLTRNARGAQSLVSKLSPEDLLLWSALAQRAHESEQSTLLKEYGDSTMGISIPIIYNCRSDYGVNYTVVVGRHILTIGGEEYRPCFVVYSGTVEGGMAYVDAADSKARGELLVRGTWTTSPEFDWDAYRSQAKTVLTRDLKL